jgi:steroid 5-alpha reductase family enzyme
MPFMFNFYIYLFSLYAILVFALAGWCLSLITDKVSHAHVMWGLLILTGASLMALYVFNLNMRGQLVLGLLAFWAVRLSLYVGLRNELDEDKRFAQMRENHEPYFWFKSLWRVFLCQAMLAWAVSISIFASLDGDTPFNGLDGIATLIVMLGFWWEIIADHQLAHFLNDARNANKVLNTGLWRFSRHPNYFGECCIWWGFFLFALANQAWWALPSPLLITWLLLKKTGVPSIETTIALRRPDYAHYKTSTNRLVPGIPNED